MLRGEIETGIFFPYLVLSLGVFHLIGRSAVFKKLLKYGEKFNTRLIKKIPRIDA